LQATAIEQFERMLCALCTVNGGYDQADDECVGAASVADCWNRHLLNMLLNVPCMWCYHFAAYLVLEFAVVV
jgi:hypothetical protein